MMFDQKLSKQQPLTKEIQQDQKVRVDISEILSYSIGQNLILSEAETEESWKGAQPPKMDKGTISQLTMYTSRIEGQRVQGASKTSTTSLVQRQVLTNKMSESSIGNAAKQSIDKEISLGALDLLHHTAIPLKTSIEPQKSISSSSPLESQPSPSLFREIFVATPLRDRQLHLEQAILGNIEATRRDLEEIKLLESKGSLLFEMIDLVEKLRKGEQASTLNLMQISHKLGQQQLVSVRPKDDIRTTESAILRLIALTTTAPEGFMHILNCLSQGFSQVPVSKFQIGFDEKVREFLGTLKKQKSELERLVNSSTRSKQSVGFSFNDSINLLYPFMPYFGGEVVLSQEEFKKYLVNRELLEQIGTCLAYIMCENFFYAKVQGHPLMLVGEPVSSEQSVNLKEFIRLVNDKLQLASASAERKVGGAGEEVKQSEEKLLQGILDFDDFHNSLKLLASPLKVLVGTIFIDTGLKFEKTLELTENMLKSRHIEQFNLQATPQQIALEILSKKPFGQEIQVTPS
ncbi:hypothetical protein FGO68_gene10231 [Halteria grandinella]|uniref:Uncharacterized protein n=1 Tax=Halteria grandinella TaxID=5974 RepID=A0A8J8T6M3_HALGN|nr:hypothetical protein FGO68_gene10231 [Halteria grandinella]